MRSLFDICNNMTKSYIERNKRSKKKNIPYSDYLLSFDIETTTWEDGTSSVYVWTISGADYNELVNCNSNSDLDRVCDKYTARTLQEFDAALVALNEAAEAANALFLVLIYNLAFEWSYISKNCDFFINNIDLDYPTVLEGRHNAMSVKAGNLVLLDATRIFGLGSLKQNAAKYGFEKLDYDYEVKRHQKTPLTEQDYIYNQNDTFITLGAWAKRVHYGGYKHLANVPLTATMMIRDSLKKNETINAQCGTRTHWKHDRGRGRKQVEKVRLFEQAVDIAKDVFSDFEIEDVAQFLESCFSGAYSHCNIMEQGNLLYNVGSADLVSAYPGAMLCHWFPRKLIEVEPSTEKLENILATYEDDLAAYTRKKLKAFCVCEVELRNLKAKRFHNENGEYTIPLISIHKVDNISERNLIDNGKILECDYLSIHCSSIDLATWRNCYDFDIDFVHRLIIGTDIQRLPKYWINAVIYTYNAKKIMKRVIKLYEKGEDWETEYRKIPECNDSEISHVKDMAFDDALYYLDMVFHQRKAELNGLYGIMVMHIIRAGYQYNTDKEVIRVDDNIRNPKDGTCYLWGIIITSITRLWEMSFSHYAFSRGCVPLYWDTDSCKCAVPNGVDFEDIVNCFNKQAGVIDEEVPEIGTYECEEIYLAFKSLGAKRYIYFEKDKDGNYKCRVTIAGLPKKMYAGFLTKVLYTNLKYSELNVAIANTAYFFKPNMYVEPDSTDKLIPKYFNEDKPTTHKLVDHLGNETYETYYSGATLTRVPFAIMSTDSAINRDYQSLCDELQGRVSDNLEPLTVSKEGDKYTVKEGKIFVPDISVYMMQKDVRLYQ